MTCRPRFLAWPHVSLWGFSMLRRACVADIRSNKVSLADGEILVAMRYYPRFLRKALITEYLSELSPSKELLRDFKEREKSLGDHNLAFEDVRFEERFKLSPTGWRQLELIAERGREKTVFLVCQCSTEQKCHCDLLLALAQYHFGADAEQTWACSTDLTSQRDS